MTKVEMSEPLDLTVVVEHNGLAIVIEKNDAGGIYRIRAFTVADFVACENYEALARRHARATQQFETGRDLALALHALFFEEQHN